jgi:DNA-binding LacI/PurR family transcriptional regulator
MTASEARIGVAKRATLTEVAKRAGVSRQTASRVARGGALVNAKTAAKVRRVIAELDYRPNLVARALSTGRTRVLGVLAHASDGYGPQATIAAIMRAAQEHGYGVTVASLESFDSDSVNEAFERLVEIGCDGVVLMAPWISDSDVLRGLITPVPVVTTSDIQDVALPSVHMDTVAAVREAVSYLLGLGHRTVTHVSGVPEQNATRLRIAGWQAALAERGAATPEVLQGDWTSQSGYAAGLSIADDHSVTAVFAANDQMALGVIYALAERGRDVPRDVSVLGFDASPDSRFYRPALTTVGVDAFDVGSRVVDLLLRMIDGEQVEAVVLPHRLIMRDSAATPS